jgi:hypothetical protein
LGDYSHTPGIHRFFCRECGGTLAWQDEKDGGALEFTVGTVDEKWLMGEDGITLADPNGKQFWSMRMIKGVTDTLPGPRIQKQ